MSEQTKEAATLIPPNTSDSDLKVYEFPGGYSLKFQNGAMELGRNGAITEEVLDMLIEHFQFFQAVPLAGLTSRPLKIHRHTIPQ